MKRWGFSDLQQTERRALTLLRASFSAGGSPLDDEFATLRAELADLDIVLPAASAHWVLHDELLMLAWLAMLQRSNGTLPVMLPADLLSALYRCAAELSEAGLVLPHRTIARTASLSAAADAGQLGMIAEAAPAPSPSPVKRLQPVRDVRARAIAMLRERTVISSDDFLASGIPLQLVNSLHRQGMIERIRAGWFRAGRRFVEQAAA